MLELNETPRRTSKNFLINNMKLDDLNIDRNIQEFSGLEIINDNSKINIEKDSEVKELTYGLGEELTNQVVNSSNNKLKIVIDGKSNNETTFEYNLDDNNLNLVQNIEILAKEDSKVTLIFKIKSKTNLENYHNGIIHLKADKDSEINVIIVNLLNDKSYNLLAIQNELEENSKVRYTIIDFGGKTSVTNYYANEIGDNSENILHTIYIGKGNQLFDLNYIAELRGKKSNVDIEVQGTLKDTAKKHFKGTIDFKKGAKKATGSENENCLLLSDTAKSIGLPMLLCSEEEVEGAHSSSAGKIDKKELFYIESKGIDEKSAMKLLVRAKFNNILEDIQNEELRNRILDEIDKRLD